MAIRPITSTPAFKGLIVSKDDKTAVNTNHIISMKESSELGIVQTHIYLTDKTVRTFKAPLNDVLKAYLYASPNDCNIEHIKTPTSDKSKNTSSSKNCN